MIRLGLANPIDLPPPSADFEAAAEAADKSE
jgi:hypothetical protein